MSLQSGNCRAFREFPEIKPHLEEGTAFAIDGQLFQIAPGADSARRQVHILPQIARMRNLITTLALLFAVSTVSAEEIAASPPSSNFSALMTKSSSKPLTRKWRCHLSPFTRQERQRIRCRWSRNGHLRCGHRLSPGRAHYHQRRARGRPVFNSTSVLFATMQVVRFGQKKILVSSSIPTS